MSDMSSWRISPMRGGSGNLNHTWITNAPGCPQDRHPTRWCDCKVHRSRKAAERYVAEKEVEA